MTYRFVGSAESKIGSIELTEFGQTIDLDEAAARNALAGGAAIVPESAFNAGNHQAMAVLAAELVYAAREGEQISTEVTHGDGE